MKIIFLDVDGVLNYHGAQTTTPEGTYFLEEEKLQILRELVAQTGAELVLSSSWRQGWNLPVGLNGQERSDVDASKYYFMLCAKLHDYGMSLLSEIPRLPGRSREDAIVYWLCEWPGEAVTEYVILDDEASKFSPANRHLLLTSPATGLQREQLPQALRILHAAGVPEGRKRLLIVDDAHTNREILKNILAPEYDILEAENGVEALNLLTAGDEAISLVITDIQMPVLSGVELIRRIRADSKLDHVAIIANTMYGDPEQEEEILNLGADDFVYKPATPKLILLRVKNALLLRQN